jgi:hypothetical protein
MVMQRREFHIHVNALSLAEGSATSLEGCGFEFKPFELLEAGTSYTPVIHYSFKSHDQTEFEHAFNTANRVLQHDSLFVGYVEGEFVRRRDNIFPSNELRPPVAPIFMLELTPPTIWRESEVHVVVEAFDGVEEALSMRAFYKSLITKGEKLYAVLTAQGTGTVISGIYLELFAHLQSYSTVEVAMKEEVLVQFFKSKHFNWTAPQTTGFQIIRRSQ